MNRISLKNKLIAIVLSLSMLISLVPSFSLTFTAQTDDAACTCNTEDGVHSEECNLFVEQLPEKCEHCGVTDGHEENCATLCTCEPFNGVHIEGCKFYVEPAPVVCPTCLQEICTCTPATVCEQCGEVECTCATVVEPIVCEHCGVELTEGVVHPETCLTNCTCEPVDGAHLDGCKFYVEPAPVVCPTCLQEICTCTPATVCEQCGEVECTCATVVEPIVCEICGKDVCECQPLMATPPSIYDELMALTTLEQMYEKLYFENYIMQLANMTADELSALSAHVDAIYNPETDTYEDYEMLKEGIGSFTGEYDNNDAEVLLPTGYIYFDLSRGSVTFKTDGTYTGYLNGNIISGTHKNNNQYYIFQGDGKKTYTDALPEYSNVTYNGTDWGDFITNHPSKSSAGDDSVDELIAAWDAANKGNRKPTENKITFQTTTSNTTFNVTIDNLWSTYQGLGNSADAALSFQAIGTSVLDDKNKDTFTDAATNITVNLTVKGDNRLSRLHCATHDGQNNNYHSDKNHTNNINFTGDSDATLTLANMSQDLTGSNGAYTAGLIGGTDRCDHSFKMKFDTITIYAGGGRLDFGSAIGGGGNGPGRITINSGRITAVNSSTGAAIGGGCGTSGPGGYGNVTINGGSVYAYNYKPHFTSEDDDSYTDALPTAIGGGSSGLQIGGTGIVNITGGYVYAYSEVGNAIGGGGGGNGWNSSYSEGKYCNTYGGTADVTISGTAEIDAISGLGCAIGGGPGGGRLYKEYADANGGQLPIAGAGSGPMGGPVNGDGGTAKLTITGNPTIRSGSIGGGSPLDQNREYGATVGAAVVNISGGTIHGQVVMDGVIKNVPSEIDLRNDDLSSFTMTGGLINNTFIDAKYHFVEENGGAVYINSGSATMSGGVIQNASSPLGGAIYLQGGNFELSGSGLIQNCSATERGGAVYVKGGDATVSGGTIQRCTAPIGGAAFVTGGNFSMSDGTIGSATEADTNTANNGAGVYVNGGQFTMSGGKMIGNKATENGGAAYVTGGNFLMSGGTIGGEGAGEANTAINGAGVYVSGSATTGKFEMSNGSITANKAATHGGAVYVSGGYITMKGGSINKNTAINGAGVYVTGGNFDMISGTLSNNIATEYGGGAYVHGGNITIGVVNCNAQNDKHDVTYPNLTHPVVLNNDASFGGGLAADGGEINIYCGKIITNTADNNGMGHNVFMYATEGNTPKLNHINGQVGDDRNHGMVVIGGELTVPINGEMITINYHGNSKDTKLEIWISDAPDEYYLNLPYCPMEWEETQNKNSLTFVGWTHDTSADDEDDIQDVVDLSFIRDKDDYRALGDPVRIHKVDWKKKDDGYYIDFYAVWAPLNNLVSYEVKLDNYGNADDDVKVMDDTMRGSNTTSYVFSQTDSDTIIMTNPSIVGYTFKGWRITPSEVEISNWSNVSNATDETAFYAYGTPSGKASLAEYSYEYSADGNTFTLTTERNFGDITMTAIFEENTVMYNFVAKSKENVSEFGSLSPNVESPDSDNDNCTYSYTIGQVTGDPIHVIAVPNSPTFRFVGWYDEKDDHLVDETTDKVTLDGYEDSEGNIIANAVITPPQKGTIYDESTAVVNYYALIEYNLTSLTVNLDNWETLTNVTGDHESVIVKVANTDNSKVFYIALDADNKFEATIYGVVVGDKYTVTEEDAWTWRYESVTPVNEYEITPPDNNGDNTNTISLTIGNKNKSHWLGGDNYAVNKFAQYSASSNS